MKSHCSLFITNSCLRYQQALTSNLKAEARDIVDAVHEISHVKATLHNDRSNVESHHAEWYQKVEEMCSDVGVVPDFPRRCGRQTHHSKTPGDSLSTHYCHTISIPLLDHLISEMDSRFTSHQQRALYTQFLCCTFHNVEINEGGMLRAPFWSG